MNYLRIHVLNVIFMTNRIINCLLELVTEEGHHNADNMMFTRVRRYVMLVFSKRHMERYYLILNFSSF